MKVKRPRRALPDQRNTTGHTNKSPKPAIRRRPTARQQPARAYDEDIVARMDSDYARLWLAALVDSSDDAIIGKTLDGIITSWNRAAQRIYGYTAEEMVGRSISQIIPPERIEEFNDIMRRLRQGDRIDHLDTVRVRKDGKRIDVSVTISPIRDAHGQLIGASTIARDITERKLAEEERRQLLEREQAAHAEAQDAVRLRDQFLSIASHELKTPLTSLLGNAQILQRRVQREGGFAERNMRALNVIANQASRLNQMINTLLDISRIQTGQLTIERAPVDLCALVRRVVAEVQPALIQHTVEYQTAEEELIIAGDELRLEQVLQNFIQNAIKYSPDGGPVRVVMERRGRRACVSVIDRGIGIPESALPNLFQRFYRAANVEERHISGMGIGLYVVKEIVTLHGGDVEVESIEGNGSTFSVCLLLEEADT